MFKKSVFKKIISVISSAVMMFSVISVTEADAASYDYHVLTYSAGDVDGIVGNSKVSYDRMSYVSFDVAGSSTFSRKGYKLTSWYVPLTGETVKTGAMYTMPDSDITFIANWTSETYKITFAGVKGVTANNEKNIYLNADCGSDIILPENEFVYSGYHFTGWKYDGNIYQPGDIFTVPALLSGEKIVFSAVWKKGSGVVTTTAPEQPVVTTTTTTVVTETPTTEAVSTNTSSVGIEATEPNGLSRTVEINKTINYNDSELRMLLVPVPELIKENETLEGISMKISSASGEIGQFTAALCASTAGGWLQKDYSLNVADNTLTITCDDKMLPGIIYYSNIQLGYWYGTIPELKVESITVLYKTDEAAETQPVTETVVETTVVTTTETTVTTEEPVSETTSSAAVTFPPLKDSKFTKTVYVDAANENNRYIELDFSDLISENQVIESMEFTFENLNGRFGYYGMSFGFGLTDYTWYSSDISSYSDSNTVTVPLAIDDSKQTLINPDGTISINYWAENADAVSIKSVKINYRIDKGDYNDDGVTDDEDINILRNYMLGVADYRVTNFNGDINDDGVINVYDFIALSRMV